MTGDQPLPKIEADPDLLTTGESLRSPGRFSAGDIIVVMLLLAFTISWPLLWAYVIDPSPAASDGSADETARGIADLIILAILFVPPIWSAVLATEIVHSRIPHRSLTDPSRRQHP